jgi:hypothetical protein
MNKVGYKVRIFFNKKYPNGVFKKDIDCTRIKKLNWKTKFNLKNSLDVVLNELRV